MLNAQHESANPPTPLVPPRADWGKRWLVVVIFAGAMAWVEAAVVFYLRTMIDRIEPYQPIPLPKFGGLEMAESVRELATLIMLTTVGLLAGRTARSRFGYMLLAFGIWDIFYYVFLKVLTGWPGSLLDWDILFLVPLPWWGPVLAPTLIALLMVSWGTLTSLGETREHQRRIPAAAWCSCGLGTVTALYVFMSDAMRVAGQGTQALRELLPQWFNWPLFLVALALMAAPAIVLSRGCWPNMKRENESAARVRQGV